MIFARCLAAWVSYHSQLIKKKNLHPSFFRDRSNWKLVDVSFITHKQGSRYGDCNKDIVRWRSKIQERQANEINLVVG